MPWRGAPVALLCCWVAGCDDPDAVRLVLPGSDVRAPDAGVRAADAGAGNGVELPTYSLETLPRDLLGYWALGETVGDCTDTNEYLNFLADGVAERIVIDDNACYPEQRGIFITPATYSLAGRELTFTMPTGFTRSLVAVGERYGERSLCQQVLVPVEPLHWQSAIESESRDGEGAFATGRDQVDLFLDTTPPISSDADGVAELRYEVTWNDERAGGGYRHRVDTFTGLTWSSRPSAYEPGVRVIELRGVPADGVEDVVSTRLGQALGWGGASFKLYLEARQPDYLTGVRCDAGRDAPPVELRR